MSDLKVVEAGNHPSDHRKWLSVLVYFYKSMLMPEDEKLVAYKYLKKQLDKENEK